MLFEGCVCTSLLPTGLHTCMVGTSFKVSNVPTSHSASLQGSLSKPQTPCPCQKLAEYTLPSLLTNSSDGFLTPGKLPETPYSSQTGCT